MWTTQFSPNNNFSRLLLSLISYFYFCTIRTIGAERFLVRVGRKGEYPSRRRCCQQTPSFSSFPLAEIIAYITDREMSLPGCNLAAGICAYCLCVYCTVVGPLLSTRRKRVSEVDHCWKKIGCVYCTQLLPGLVYCPLVHTSERTLVGGQPFS